MFDRLKSLRWRKKLLLAAFALVLAFTSLQIFRTIQRARYWSENRDEPIAGWMRIGYVAKSYRVPPQVLHDAIGLPPDQPDRRPLSEIAKAQDRSLEDVKLDLERAIAVHRAIHEPPESGGGP